MDTIKNIASDRIYWGAILAGLIITLSGEALLNLLGLGFGLSAFTVDADALSNIGIGTLIWLVISGIICMFAGGWVTSRLANIHFYLEGALHGLVTWGLATLFAILLMATSAGSLISGITSVVGHAFSFTGQSVETLGKNIAQIAPPIPPLDNIEFSEETHESVEKIKSELQEDLNVFLTSSNDDAATNARQKLMDFLVKNKGMDQLQAEQKINEWQQNYNTIKQEMKEKSIAAAEQTSSALGKIAMMTFFVFLLSAIAGAAGGIVGVINKR